MAKLPRTLEDLAARLPDLDGGGLASAESPPDSTVGMTSSPPPYTARQGQFLTFIYYYTKLNGRPPAEADMQRYFGVTPPVVHDMVKTLERKGLIAREAGRPRSIRLLMSRSELPDLE